MSPQWLLGCGFFLFPGASFSVRGQYKPQHIFFGIALFILSIMSCLLGITEMLLFKIRWVTKLGQGGAPSDLKQRDAPVPAQSVALQSPLEACISAAAESLTR